MVREGTVVDQARVMEMEERVVQKVTILGKIRAAKANGHLSAHLKFSNILTSKRGRAAWELELEYLRTEEGVVE